MLIDQTVFQIGQRVRIISSDRTATVEATFTLVPGYYDVCLDNTAIHRIAFETDLEALESVKDLPACSAAA
jgi:hypothetical protein